MKIDKIKATRQVIGDIMEYGEEVAGLPMEAELIVSLKYNIISSLKRAYGDTIEKDIGVEILPSRLDHNCAVVHFKAYTEYGAELVKEMEEFCYDNRSKR